MLNTLFCSQLHTVSPLTQTLTSGILNGPKVCATARVGEDDARPMTAGTGAVEMHLALPAASACV